MNPAVLVYSHGIGITPTDVITNILEASGVAGSDIKPTEESANKNLPAYTLNIKTKYYENAVDLMPQNETLHNVPASVEDITEAIIVYFDADNKSFLNELPNICQWLVAHNIELGVLITKNLCDDLKKGITRTELHKVCSESKFIFNVIELSNTEDDEDDDDEDEDEVKKHEYHEVLDSLRMNVWSNVECNAYKPSNHTNNQITPDADETEESVESQLEAFENLLHNIQNFQLISGNLTRDQLLDEADKLVGMFCNTIGDDFADDDDDDDDSAGAENTVVDN